MVKKGGVYSTEGIIYGYNPTKGGAWGLVKVPGEAKGEKYQLWVKNPERIEGCDKIRIVEILGAFTNQHYSKAMKRWYTNLNLEVMAMPADKAFRETEQGMVTPEDDLARFLFGVQGGNK